MRGKNIKKAMLYSYNKVAHSLVRFKNEISFEIKSIVDLINYNEEDAGEIIGEEKLGIKIKKDLNGVFEDIDTVIFTDHFGENRWGLEWFAYKNKKLNAKEKFLYVLNEALKHKKNIYSVKVDLGKHLTDEQKKYIEEENITVEYPRIDTHGFIEKGEYDTYQYNIKTPIISIFGTSSMQGKWTTQLKLKRELISSGLKIGHIGTERSSYLLGCDEMFANEMNEAKRMSYLYRHIIKKVDKKNYDSIIFGGQASIIPSTLDANIGAPETSLKYLFAFNPDIIYLVVNADTEKKYIYRCIKTLECISEKKVQGLILSPMIPGEKNEWHEMQLSVIKDEEEKEVIEGLNKLFKIPVYSLKNNGISELREDLEKIIPDVKNYKKLKYNFYKEYEEENSKVSGEKIC